MSSKLKFVPDLSVTKAQPSSPSLGVRHGDDGHLLDRRVAVQRLLDLGDGNVLAAADDDVLGAAGDSDVALFVHVGDVAGVKPAFLVRAVLPRIL